MLAVVHSCALLGLEGEIIEVQVDYSASSLPAFQVVGLPDTAVQESRERVRAAIKNTGLTFKNQHPNSPLFVAARTRCKSTAV